MIQKIKNQQLQIITPFDINDQRLINVSTPSEQKDAVNKSYVDVNAINYSIGTGLYMGCMITIDDNTHFSISSGVGYIVDPTTKNSTFIVIPSHTGVSLMSVGPTDITVSVGILSDGSVFQQIPIFSAYQRRTMICLGELILDPITQVLWKVAFEPVFSWDASTAVDSYLSNCIKNLQGNTVTSSGATMTMNVSSGKMCGYSVNAINSYSNPNERTYPAISVFPFSPTYHNGTEWVYTATGTTLDPDLYSNGTSSLQPVASNKWSVRLMMRGAFTGGMWMSYPTMVNGVYQDAAQARADIPNLYVTIPDELINRVLPLYFILVRGGATDLSNTNDAVFIPVSSMVVTAGGSVSVLAADVVFDNSTTTGVTSVDVQGALVEINNKIESLNYSSNNKDMVALSGTTGIYKATNTTITDIPRTAVRVEVNGVEVPVGNGTVNSWSFFSSDGGSTAKTYTNVAQGDSLYWNRTFAPYNLQDDPADSITFIYMVY